MYGHTAVISDKRKEYMIKYYHWLNLIITKTLNLMLKS